MDIRKLKFIQLVDETDGGQAEVAKRLGYKNPTYASQMYTGRRSIGEKSARKIEKAMNKPHCWLDYLDEQANNKIQKQGVKEEHALYSKDDVEILNEIQKLSDANRACIPGILRALNQKLDKKTS